MKNRLLTLTAAALAMTSPARDFEMTVWRGETATARIYDYATIGEAPTGIVVKTGVARRTDYLDGRLGTQYAAVADRVVWGAREPGPRILSVSVSPELKPGSYRCGDLVVKVLDRVLPPPAAWKYNLDLWQHPWAVARWYGVEPFSAPHYARMRPLWEMLASAGQKPLTVTITDLPWNHQCHDAYRSMVRRVRHADGSWTFDYRVFDEYVAFGRSCGLGKKIHCYTMCPWDYEVYWDEDDGTRKSTQAIPGTAAFRDYWERFLVDFAAHLKEKGWFDATYICLDERSREEVEKVCSFIREKAPGLKTSLAADRKPSEFSGIEIDDYCSGMPQLTDVYLAEAAGRRARGKCTTFYVCCGPDRPNTFMSSMPEESFWLGVYPGVIGLDGFLRWAWNSWPRDPYRDASYTGLGRGWPPGDTFLVYPNGEPSLRFLELKNGIVAAEKLRILKETGVLSDAVQADLKKRFDFREALNGRDWRADRKAVQAVVNAEPKVAPAVAQIEDSRALLKELVGIPSVSANITEVNRAVDVMKGWLEHRAVSCVVERDANGRKVLWASTRPGQVQDIVFVCHLDVVPAPDKLFALTARDGRIFGRGTCDCKANAVVCAEVLARLVGKASVGCIFSTDEEIGGSTTALMIARGYLPRQMAVVVDLAEYGAVYAHKGHALLRLVAHGSKGHSSAPWKSQNALERLMMGCARIRQEWNRAHGVATAEDQWHDTLAITMATSSSKVANAVPDRAEATASLRYVSADGCAAAVAFLKETSGLDVEIIRNGGPVTSDAAHPRLQSFLARMRRVWKDENLQLVRMNGATDARHLAGLGVPIVIVGSESGGAHADDEWCDLAGLSRLRELLAEVAQND